MEQIEKIAGLVLSELNHFSETFTPQAATAQVWDTQLDLRDEPFIGYLETVSGGENEYLLICRNYTPHRYDPLNPKVSFASYLEPNVGRLMTAEPGQAHEVRVRDPHLPQVVHTTRYEIISKDEFRPLLDAQGWDARNNKLALVGFRQFIESLRDWRAGLGQPTTRRLAVRVQLPEQAILDSVQDPIFRVAVNQTILISGAPGTGKTTVVLKRLAQKTKYEFLTDDEKRLVDRAAWRENENWVLFTPSDLLKGYLKEALSKERLPATDSHVRVWGSYKSDLLRDIKFLRVGNQGIFTKADRGATLLKRQTGAESLALTKAFCKALPVFIDDYFREEVLKFAAGVRAPSAQLRTETQNILLKALDAMSAAGSDVIQQREAQRRVDAYRTLAATLDRVLKFSEETSALADRPRGDKRLCSPAIIAAIRQQVSGRLGEVTGLELYPSVFPNLPALVASVRSEIAGLSERFAFPQIFGKIPAFYQEFRKQHLERFFKDDAASEVNARKVDALELDTLLFAALEIVREYHSEDTPTNSAPGFLWSQMRGMVAIDEATDFSPAEIGCMQRLSSPSLGSLTLSGDLMQRLTPHGLSKWEDLAEVEVVAQKYLLEVSYRQTHRLLQVAADLYRHFMNEEPAFRSAYEAAESDPPPLHFKATATKPSADWIAERVVEIYEINGGRLPTIGVLVPEVGQVADFTAKLSDRLYPHTIEVEGSLTGQNLGDSARVRVFAVEHIKGLEFEAVFYVDIDQMAEKAANLIERYLYVGLSRARSFLGMTYTTQFPRRLDCVRKHFPDQETFGTPPA